MSTAVTIINIPGLDSGHIDKESDGTFSAWLGGCRVSGDAASYEACTEELKKRLRDDACRRTNSALRTLDLMRKALNLLDGDAWLDQKRNPSIP